jgi:hypothetical protein
VHRPRRVRDLAVAILAIVVYAAPAIVLARNDPSDAVLFWLLRHLGAGVGPMFAGLLHAVGSVYGVLLVAVPFAVALLVTLRAFARRRLHAQGIDVFAKARARLAVDPARVRRFGIGAGALTAVVAPFFNEGLGSTRPEYVTAFVAGLMLSGAGVAGLTGALVRALVAPLGNDKPTDDAMKADGMFFSAVAVTREARGLVAAFAAFSIVALGVLSFGAWSGPALAAAIAAYIALAIAATFAFRRASRVAIGVDGVLVTGTSRTRFFPYRGLDDADVSTFGDVVLKKDGKVVVRLQVHGEDAPRTMAFAERIRANIAGARDAADDGAQRLAERAPDVLARAARGDGSYRAQGATREALWEIVESSASSSEARTAAARALAERPSSGDRRRLRVAAEHCADPTARAKLLRLAPSVSDDLAIFEAEAAAEATDEVPRKLAASRESV